MDEMGVVCPHCGLEMEGSAKLTEGRPVRCPGCGVKSVFTEGALRPLPADPPAMPRQHPATPPQPAPQVRFAEEADAPSAGTSRRRASFSVFEVVWHKLVPVSIVVALAVLLYRGLDRIPRAGGAAAPAARSAEHVTAAPGGADARQDVDLEACARRIREESVRLCGDLRADIGRDTTNGVASYCRDVEAAEKALLATCAEGKWAQVVLDGLELCRQAIRLTTQNRERYNVYSEMVDFLGTAGKVTTNAFAYVIEPDAWTRLTNRFNAAVKAFEDEDMSDAHRSMVEARSALVDLDARVREEGIRRAREQERTQALPEELSRRERKLARTISSRSALKTCANGLAEMLSQPEYAGARAQGLIRQSMRRVQLLDRFGEYWQKSFRRTRIRYKGLDATLLGSFAWNPSHAFDIEYHPGANTTQTDTLRIRDLLGNTNSVLEELAAAARELCVKRQDAEMGDPDRAELLLAQSEALRFFCPSNAVTSDFIEELRRDALSLDPDCAQQLADPPAQQEERRTCAELKLPRLPPRVECGNNEVYGVSVRVQAAGFESQNRRTLADQRSRPELVELKFGQSKTLQNERGDTKVRVGVERLRDGRIRVRVPGVNEFIGKSPRPCELQLLNPQEFDEFTVNKSCELGRGELAVIKNEAGFFFAVEIISIDADRGFAIAKFCFFKAS